VCVLLHDFHAPVTDKHLPELTRPNNLVDHH